MLFEDALLAELKTADADNNKLLTAQELGQHVEGYDPKLKEIAASLPPLAADVCIVEEILAQLGSQVHVHMRTCTCRCACA